MTWIAGWEKVASRKIKNTTERVTVEFEDGDVEDIISVIMKADQLGAEFTKAFAEDLRKTDDYQTLKEVWLFVKRNIKYLRDQPGEEVVKSPGKTWKDRRFGSDCKSFSVMIGSLIKNLGYSYFYRVTFYDENNPEQGHIYPVAILDGQEVILDAVHSRFDEEVPYWKAYDYYPKGSSAGVSGLIEQKSIAQRVTEGVIIGLITYGIIQFVKK